MSKPPKEDLPPKKDDQVVENQIIQSSVGNDSGIRIHKWGSRIRQDRFLLICVQFISEFLSNSVSCELWLIILLFCHRMKEDVATYGIITESQKRQLIAKLVSQIRFQNMTNDLNRICLKGPIIETM